MTWTRNSWMDTFPITIISLLFLLQMITGFYLLPDISQNTIVAYLGVGLYSSSGLIFGMLPIIEFRKKGGVQKGKSYVNTTRLVDTGIYSIVRHPQYLTWAFSAIAGMLLFQHWIVILFGAPIIPFTYIDMINEDRHMIEKFGGEYREYMQRVPRANFISGLILLLRRKK